MIVVIVLKKSDTPDHLLRRRDLKVFIITSCLAQIKTIAEMMGPNRVINPHAVPDRGINIAPR